MSVGTRDWLEGGHAASSHPTIGAQVIGPVLDRKICKALKRSARKIAFRLFLRFLLLDLGYLSIKVRYAFLRSARDFIRLLSEVIENARHGISPR